MEETKLTCICCPLGCEVTVETENKEVTSVYGFTCKRGEIYAKSEVQNPVRMVTGTVKVKGGAASVVSVKTSRSVPKGKVFDIAGELQNVSVMAPVRMGDVLIRNAAGTGANIVATKAVDKHV